MTARGPVKVVARPERLALLEHGAAADNTLPGMVERTVYVGSNLQVMVRLATGVQLQASITNTGRTSGMAQGTPIAVQIPADALRVLRDDTAGRSTGGGADAQDEVSAATV
jgi:mannopine transport system ATP-binding protein